MSLYSFSLVFVIILFLQLASCLDPDHNRNTVALIESRGFGYEKHFVTTEDGYILTVFRIVHPHISDKERGKPVILQHGLLSSSRDWLINSPGGHVDENTKVPGNNLGFELVKKGYDVWIPNSRGNTYSRNHTRFTPKDKSFWDFSFSELIKYDLPATIDYVLKETNNEQLGYIGHSQGTMMMFGLLSTQKKYNNMIKPFIALAPVATLRFIRGPLKYVAKIAILPRLLGAYGGPFLPSSYLTKFVAEHVCASPIRDLCTNAVFIGNGFDKTQTNSSRMGVYASGVPAGTSAKNMVHYVQLIKSGLFRDYDYGITGNIGRYGQSEPPQYPLDKITNPNIALIHSANDYLSSLGDNAVLRESLQVRPICDHLVPVPHWNHLDFIIAMQQHKYVNSKIYEILETNRC